MVEVVKLKTNALSMAGFEQIVTAVGGDSGVRVAAIWCYLAQEPDGFIDYRPHEISAELGFGGNTGRKYIARLKDLELIKESSRGEGRRERRTGFEFAIDSSGGRRW